MYVNLIKIFLIYSLSFQVTFSKKLNIPNIDSHTGKLTECKRCKILTESFNHWLDKTSRGKFEGGDAAWEEAKLRSYARSEVRLIEIQEGLCSELNKHQDQCYSLNEDVEMAIEKWWFQDDPNSADLYYWLCIENLKHCCPQNHFGESCLLCPLDKNNKICSGNGKCDGDGTRQGNGSCVCRKGFVGAFCEDCAKNYYAAASGCEPCHRSCDGCSGNGPSACHACKSGWIQEGDSCNDIDECLNPETCKTNQYCINKQGSYSCKSCDKSCKTCHNKGSSNCTSCPVNTVLWSGTCIDNNMKYNMLFNVSRRLTVYLGLLIAAMYLFRQSTYLSSIVVLILTIYIYFIEKHTTNNIINVVSLFF